MGGVGKTTLARLLYDEKELKDHFELRAWVCVSDEFNIFDISKVIYQSVTGEKREYEDLNLLQEALRAQLMNKLFLIVLDDVWSEGYGEWDKLVGPFLAGAPGSKIIMTTRKQQLLRKLGYVDQDSLQGLLHDDALSLFAQHALGVANFDSHPSLRPYGEGFVKKCDGLPLALRALGRLLRTKTDDEEWKELLDSEIWKLGNRDEIIPALRLSYHDLSASLKQVFAYCCLFPKHYVFDKEELILLWMAEGFLHQSTTNKSMECLGLEYFEDLLSRSFFQHAPDDNSLFLMHDLMNDLAIFVAGDFFSRLDIEMRRELRMEGLKKCRHRSFVCEKYMIYERFNTFRGAKYLRTVLALSSAEGDRSLQTFYLSNKVLADLLHRLPLIRVLSLSNLNISEVPDSIGSLNHLRYLNLSQTKITHLPDNVCNLYNLQSLILFGCHCLQELPKSFLKLRNLRHFDMRDTPLLKKMPLGIGELKSLRTLSKIIIEGDNGFSITVLKHLKDLQGNISIKGLEKVQSPRDAKEANLSHRGLSELEVEWSDVFDGSRKETLEKEVLDVLRPRNDSLKKFGIVSYGGTEFPNWVGDPSFIRLTHVSIRSCKKCISLPPLGKLPSLKELFIGGMDEVKVLGLEFLGSTGLAFPSLEILSFFEMRGLEVWSTNTRDFPRLQELRLDGCPNLVTVSLEALPSLRVLNISKCGHDVLTSMVHVASMITMLNIHHISGLDDQMWGGVTEYLGAVEEVTMRKCNEIRYLWESEAEAGKVLVNLRKLDIWECSNLVSLGEKEEDHCGSNLPSLKSLVIQSLKSLVIQGCNKLKWCSCPNSIETLEICKCKSITSLSFPAGEQNLKVLTIHGSKELLEQGEQNRVFVNSRMRMLESVDIFLWPSQTPIIELSCFIHLTRLVIKDCPNVESFPDHELPNLTLLTSLIIENCPNIDASFPRGLWPPNLIWLRIGGLKKPISEWDPQNFPTSLVSLHLTGGRSEDASNFSQLSHLLPSSLIYLGIEEFEKLESVSVGLQHLISLQHLSINKCPKTRNLPKMLLPALLSLKISECPILKEMSSKRGYYWPLTAHIPRINMS